jgi:hypothetical protein
LYQTGTDFVTTFTAPYSADADPSRASDTFRFQLQLGGDLKPTYQTDSIGELFYRLRVCQGMVSGTDSVVIEFKEYYTGDKFIIGISMERVLGNEVARTGVSTMGS